MVNWELQKQQMRQNSHLEKISKLFNELVESNIISSEIINATEDQSIAVVPTVELRTELQTEIEDLEKYKKSLINDIEVLERRKLQLQIPASPVENMQNGFGHTELSGSPSHLPDTDHFRNPTTMQTIPRQQSKLMEIDELIQSLM